MLRESNCFPIDYGRGIRRQMKSITAEEWQLLSFFESEPELLDPQEHWAYNDAVYSVTDCVVELSVSVHPAYRDVRIILESGGHRLYEFESMGLVTSDTCETPKVNCLKSSSTSAIAFKYVFANDSIASSLPNRIAVVSMKPLSRRGTVSVRYCRTLT